MDAAVSNDGIVNKNNFAEKNLMIHNLFAGHRFFNRSILIRLYFAI